MKVLRSALNEMTQSKGYICRMARSILLTGRKFDIETLNSLRSLFIIFNLLCYSTIKPRTE